MRMLLAITVALMLAFAGCGERAGAPAPPAAVVSAAPAASATAQANAVAAYLDGAEVQAETDAQRRELRRALVDMLTRSGAELRDARYAGAAGEPGARDLAAVLRAHLVPATPRGLDPDRLHAELGEPSARAAVQRQLDALDRSLAGSPR